MIRRPPRSTQSRSSAASDVYKRQGVIYEGTPDFPNWERWWEIIERYKVSILYTAPTAIRAHMKQGSMHAEKHDLSSLRLLGTVGEPINPEAWIWYHKNIGAERCPIVDTWWQTETGAAMISPISVCHQVSTIGQRPPPICSWYQSQARGLIGSPTEPSRRSVLRSCLAGCSTPHFMQARIAVGAVYRIVTP